MPKGKPVDLDSPTKWCPACKQDLPWGNFYSSKSTATGYQNRCKDCSYKAHNNWRLKNLDKMSKDRKERYKQDPERYKDYDRKKNYGLEPGEYAQLLKKQGGKCAICQTTTPGGRGAFHVDHCHDSFRVRGLLCHSCNIGIGQFKHNEKLLQAAINYLSKSSTEG